MTKTMKLAFIDAIDKYPKNPLHGCINDLNDWNTTLKSKGFSTILLKDSKATKVGILNGLRQLVDAAQPGDTLVWAYSHHGSKVADTSGDEPDGFDEVLCPYDYFSGQYIIDDEVRMILDQLPAGVTLDIFADTCYSGTATRGIDTSVITPRVLPGPLTHGKKAKKAVSLVPNLNHCLHSACASNEVSAEVMINGVPRGIFSYYMCKAIRNYPTKTRAELNALVSNAVKKVIPNQTPQLEATITESKERPFL